MPILNPNHLFEQADKMIAAPASGPPLQVDLRRAISSAYYALFHLTATALADEFVGAAHRGSSRYDLVHRSVDHRAIKDLCLIAAKTSPPPKYVPYVSLKGFGRDILIFAEAVVELQVRRHQADYAVMERYRTRDAMSAVEKGRTGMERFRAADPSDRRLFLTLLLCPPR